jgi:hypothetical protein
MNTDNIVPFIRGRSSARSSPRGPSHAHDPDELLHKLRWKRLEKTDQEAGRLIVRFYPDNAKAIAGSLLEDNEREKRTIHPDSRRACRRVNSARGFREKFRKDHRANHRVAR